jgi:hypothetical protein
MHVLVLVSVDIMRWLFINFMMYLIVCYFGYYFPTLRSFLRKQTKPSKAIPPRRPGFEPGSGHKGFMVDKAALGQVFS